MRSWALEGKCMPRMRYAGARRRQSETQEGRDVPVVGDVEVASAKVVTERRCASPVSPRISAATSHAHVGASPYRGSTAHLGTPPPVDGVSIVSV